MTTGYHIASFPVGAPMFTVWTDPDTGYTYKRIPVGWVRIS